ncbi:DUF3187 family protein [Abditibacterium utsteinense]|uniref:DUF3187 family protein n=1 Tax=Abditibacterium utsteinense TaxID=1960156 RepID=UPI00130096C3|nr:DUF3187 family protein [Abditibacterium utsteinense]
MAPVCNAQQRWRGPLPVENQRPYQAVFLHLPAQNPDVLTKNEAKIGVQFDVANNLLIPNISGGASVREDFETGRGKIEFQRGIGKGLEIGASTQYFVRDGGSLDNAISFYHHLLGISGDGPDNPEGRDNIARNQDRLFFQDAQGNGIDVGGANGLGDTTLNLKRQLRAGDFASALRVALKVPTGSERKVFGSGGFDAGIGLDARRTLAPNLALFGNVAALAFGNSDLPNTKSSGAQGGLGLEYKGKRASVVAQIDAQSRTLTTGNSFADRTPVLASVGYKRDVGQNKRLWASFSENGDYHNFKAPFFGNIGPDFTLSLGFEVRR